MININKFYIYDIEIIKNNNGFFVLYGAFINRFKLNNLKFKTKRSAKIFANKILISKIMKIHKINNLNKENLSFFINNYLKFEIKVIANIEKVKNIVTTSVNIQYYDKVNSTQKWIEYIEPDNSKKSNLELLLENKISNSLQKYLIFDLTKY